MEILHLAETDSTNSYVSSHAGELADMTMVVAEKQTAGRGQRGNSWESAPGMNLTFTLFFRPKAMAPSLQFAVSEATALAMVDFLSEQEVKAKIKWPNDIYVGDKKIAGILIEHSITPTHIEHSRIGVGVNVNQLEFISDAPNPVSLAQITGKKFDLKELVLAAAEALKKRLEMLDSEGGIASIHGEFKDNLWRYDGKKYDFRRNNQIFQGIILDVSPKGPVTIMNCTTGRQESYFFKEIEFVI